MRIASRVNQSIVALAAGILLLAGAASANEQDAPKLRWEIWLAATNWSGVSDLEPAAGGSFDDLGFGIGGGVHWPVMTGASSELLLGIEGGALSHGSNIQGDFEDLVSRDGFVALSAKWLPTSPRGLSLDAGFAYHLVDISQVDDEYLYYYHEFESWEDSAAGPFLGLTWDTWAGNPEKDAGLSLGFEVHFVDFGIVRDEDIYISPVLGPDAGSLDGPMFLFQLGYSSR